MARRASASKKTSGDVRRVGFRIDAETKALLDQAASIEHASITQFCLAAIRKAARESIAQAELLALTARDQAILFEALMNPPALHPRLARALEDERETIAP